MKSEQSDLCQRDKNIILALKMMHTFDTARGIYTVAKARGRVLTWMTRMSSEKLINLRFIHSVSNASTKREQNAIDKTLF